MINREIIKLCAIGFCADEKKSLSMEQTRDTVFAADLLRELGGRVNFRKNGECSVFPLKGTGNRIVLRTVGADADMFMFFAGIVSQTGHTLMCIGPDINTERFVKKEFEDKTCGCLEAGLSSNALYVCAKEKRSSYIIGEKTDENFVAGLMLGALLRSGDTDIIMSMRQVSPFMLTVAGIIKDGGGKIFDLTEGFRIPGK